MVLQEVVNEEGLRLDGRRAPELRRIHCRVGVSADADGSSYLEHGNTKCLALVYGPKEPSRRGGSSHLHDKGTITVNISIASFSTGERKQRLKNDRRLVDIENSIERLFKANVMVSTFPRSEVSVEIHIVQLDGGLLQAAINATTLALIDAGVPMLDYVSACTAGYANNSAVLDLNLTEESMDIPVVTIAILPKSNKCSLLTMESRMHLDNLPEVLLLANEGGKQIHHKMQEALRATYSKTVSMTE